MKKWIFVICSFLSFTSSAESFSCGYKDYFHLSSDTHPGIYISNASDDMDVIMQVISPRSFIIRDTRRCSSGYAHVTVAYDESHWCVLDIKDGPYLWHPGVKASCHGIEYLGTDYDGFGSYSYTIKLN